jgi:hypothetical protein
VQNMQRVPRHWELSNQNDSLLPKSRNALLFEHARSRKCTKGQSSIPSSCWSYPAHTSAYLNLLDRIPETTYVIDLVGVVLIQMTQKQHSIARLGKFDGTFPLSQTSSTFARYLRMFCWRMCLPIWSLAACQVQ